MENYTEKVIILVKYYQKKNRVWNVQKSKLWNVPDISKSIELSSLHQKFWISLPSNILQGNYVRVDSRK